MCTGEGLEVEGVQDALQPGHRARAHLMRKRVEREEQSRGVKRRRATGLGMLKKRRSKQERPGQETVRGEWHLEGFSTGPGNTKPMAGRYMAKAVQSQVWVQAGAGNSKEIWLGVKLSRDKWNVSYVTGWMHSGELQRRAGGDGEWAERLRGKGREGWSVQEHRWEGNGSAQGSTGRARRVSTLFQPKPGVLEIKFAGEGCQGLPWVYPWQS